MMIKDEWRARTIKLIHPFLCPYRRWDKRCKDFICTQPYAFYFDIPEKYDCKICNGTVEGFIECPLEALDGC